jgi:glycosyl transferase, family 25
MLSYFDSVYIINLPSRTDRRLEMEDQFSKIGVQIDGKRVRFFPAIRPDGPADFPTLGTRGCFMSHLAALTHARDRGVGNVLLLEDDCNFVGNFNRRIAILHGTLPKSAWSFFYGGALNTIEPNRLQNGWLDSAQAVVGAHFLAVNNTVLPELVAYLEVMIERPAGDPSGGPMHVDGAYSWFRAAHQQCTTYLALPDLAYQRSSATDIHQRKWYEASLAMQWIFKQLRRAKNAVGNVCR